MGASAYRKCIHCDAMNAATNSICDQCSAILPDEAKGAKTERGRHASEALYGAGLKSALPLKTGLAPISLADVEALTPGELSAEKVIVTSAGGMQQRYEKLSSQQARKRGLFSRRELIFALTGFTLAGGVLGYQWSRSVHTPDTLSSSLVIPTPLGANSHLAPAENFSVAWSTKGEYLGLASEAGTLVIKNALSDATLINDTSGAINDLAWSPHDNGLLACAYDDSTIQIRQIPQNVISRIYREHANPVLVLGWTHDGKYIASADQEPVLKVWNASSLETLASYSNVFGGEVTSLSWSPSGMQLVCGCADSTVIVLDVAKNQQLLSYTGHDQAIEAVAWSPDGRYIASTGDDGSVQVWYPHDGTVLRNYKGHTDKVWCLAWSPDSQFLASGSWDKTVRIWRVVASGKEPYQIFTRHQDRVVALDWSSQGRIASIDASGNIFLWNTK